MVRITPQQIINWAARNLEYRSRKGGTELILNNPFDGDTGHHFNINTVKGVVHDWRPGHQHFDGPFLRFVQRYKNCSFFEALRDVCGQGVDLRAVLRAPKPEEIEEEPQEPSFELPAGAISFRKDGDDMVRQIALQYLAGRGITEDMAKKNNLHYNVNMIYFPYSEYGVQVYWQGRTIMGKKFEFPIITADVGKTSFLYGFDNCEPYEPLIVNESIIDSITLGDHATASGGAGMSIKQAKKIRAIGPSMVILAPDRDFEGVMSLQGNLELLKSVMPHTTEFRFVVPPAPFKDWNEMWQNNPRAYVDANLKLIIPPNIQRARQSI